MRVPQTCLGGVDLFSLLKEACGEGFSFPNYTPITKYVLPVLLLKRQKLTIMTDHYGEYTLTEAEYRMPENSLILSSSTADRPPVQPGFETVRDLELFAERTEDVRVRVYTNASKRITIVVMLDASDRVKRERYDTFIASLIPRLCPWVFNSPLTDEEKNLLRAISEHKQEEVTRLLTDFYSSESFKDFWLEIETASIIKQFQTGKLQILRDEIENIYENIRQETERLAQMKKQVHDKEVLASDIMLHSVDSSMVTEAIKVTRDKIHVDFEYGKPVYTVRSDLVNFDFESAIARMEGYDYQCWGNGPDMKMVEKALTKVFKSNKYRVQLVSVFDTDNGYIEVFHHNGNQTFMENRLPNPHHRNYHCLGSYEMDLVDLSTSGDFYGFFMTMIESTGSVNVDEGITMERFINTMRSCYYDTKFIRDVETGELYTLEQINLMDEEGHNENDQSEAQ